MSKSAKPSIENAAQIIEAFGGIRPMSNKINIAVTTIQGWKKRGAIPFARKGVILKAAKEHNVDLSEFFDDAPLIVAESSGEVLESKNTIENDTIENDNIVEIPVYKPDKTDEFAPKVERKVASKIEPRKEALEHKNFTEIAMTTERKTMAKSAIIAVVAVFVIIAAAISMMWPSLKDIGERGSRLASLENEIHDMKKAQSSFKGFVPENWSKQLSDLKNQVSQAKDAVGSTVNSVKNLSKDLTQANGLESRVVKLQSYVSEISNSSGMYSLLSRFQNMEGSKGGENMLDNAVLNISAIMAGAEGKDDSYINNALNLARSQNASMQQTLGDVPQSELKAAAMLLALTQVRSALNRNDEAFDNDLALLMNMVGDDNAELKSSLEKLSPHAKTGLLSTSGLQKEFRTVAGEVVAASLSGEDVSFSEKATARMNDILKLEKDGELLTGTQTQVKVKKADKMMKNGNLAGALTYLKKSLNAKELKPLRPWLYQAEAVLESAKIKKALEQAIELNVGSGYLGGSQLLNDE